PARTSSAAALILAIVTLHRIEKLRGVVSDAVFENDFDVLDIGNALGRIAFDHNEVGVLSDGDRSDPILPAEEDRAIECRDADRLHRREAGFNEQLDLALIAEAGAVAADADRIRT